MWAALMGQRLRWWHACLLAYVRQTTKLVTILHQVLDNTTEQTSQLKGART